MKSFIRLYSISTGFQSRSFKIGEENKQRHEVSAASARGAALAKAEAANGPPGALFMTNAGRGGVRAELRPSWIQPSFGCD
jgi:hypothetical protein